MALRRRAKAIAGSRKIANDACIPELADGGAKGREGWRSVASGVCIVSVKLVTAPPGGMKEGLIDEVAPVGTPWTASAMGLAIAAPSIATEKLYVAELPFGMLCVVVPVAVSVKSDAAPTASSAVADPLGRKFASPEYDALRLCAPNASPLVVNEAAPAESATTAIDVLPSASVMEPVGTPLVVLVACTVSVMGRPNPGALVDAVSEVSVGACAMLRLTAGVTATV
jgi:hypothetical protein